jgi:hypothetical protein
MPKASPDEQRRALAEALDRRTDQAALHDHRGQPDAGHGEPDHELVEAVAIHHVEHGDAREARVRQIVEEIDCREPQQSRLRAQ